MLTGPNVVGMVLVRKIGIFKALNWLYKVNQESPDLFPHWTIGAIPSNGINNKSRMTGDCYVRFRENLGAAMPGVTRLSHHIHKHPYAHMVASSIMAIKILGVFGFFRTFIIVLARNYE